MGDYDEASGYYETLLLHLPGQQPSRNYSYMRDSRVCICGLFAAILQAQSIWLKEP